MTRQSHGQGIDTRLLILGGAGIVLAYLLMNQQQTPAASDTSGGSSGFDLSSLLSGLGSPAAGPTIYQFPPEATVNFPTPTSDADLLAKLLALLGAGAPADQTAKKDQVLTSAGGQIVDSSGKVWQPGPAGTYVTVLNKKEIGSGVLPAGISSAAGTPTAAAQPTKTGFNLLDYLGGLLNVFPLENRPEFSGVATATESPTATGGGLAATVPTKKASALYGMSGQYALDPYTGRLIWSGQGTDPATGNLYYGTDSISKFLSDVFIYGRETSPIYVPGTYGNPATVAAANVGTFTTSKFLDTQEQQKAYYQAVVVGNVLAAGGTPAPYYSNESKKIVAEYATTSPSMPETVSKKETVISAGGGSVSLPITSRRLSVDEINAGALAGKGELRSNAPGGGDTSGAISAIISSISALAAGSGGYGGFSSFGGFGGGGAGGR